MELEEIIENVKEAKLILLCNNVIELIVVITEGRKQGLFKNKFWDLENDEELDLSKLKNIAIEPVLKELDKQEKMIELIEKECRQRLAFAKRIRRSEKRNPDDFNQGLEFESATIMNLLSGEPHWEYEGKYFDDIDKQVEKLKAEEIE